MLLERNDAADDESDGCCSGSLLLCCLEDVDESEAENDRDERSNARNDPLLLLLSLDDIDVTLDNDGTEMGGG